VELVDTADVSVVKVELVEGAVDNVDVSYVVTLVLVVVALDELVVEEELLVEVVIVVDV